MIYGYIRVSTDKQTVENQRFEILNYAEKHNLIIDEWIEETVSGTKSPKSRRLGVLLQKVQKGDKIICSELSRLGRSLLMIMSILNQLLEKECTIYTIKDNYTLGDDLQSKVLAFAFGISAEIERALISQRTKEALKRKKSLGIKLGRPKGHAKKLKLTEFKEIIEELLALKIAKTKIAAIFNVSTATLYSFLARNNLH